MASTTWPQSTNSIAQSHLFQQLLTRRKVDPLHLYSTLDAAGLIHLQQKRTKIRPAILTPKTTRWSTTTLTTGTRTDPRQTWRLSLRETALLSAGCHLHLRQVRVRLLDCLYRDRCHTMRFQRQESSIIPTVNLLRRSIFLPTILRIKTLTHFHRRNEILHSRTVENRDRTLKLIGRDLFNFLKNKFESN